jgi:hypothetical protein
MQEGNTGFWKVSLRKIVSIKGYPGNLSWRKLLLLITTSK